MAEKKQVKESKDKKENLKKMLKSHPLRRMLKFQADFLITIAAKSFPV
jgi:hypothetical protein